MSIKTGKDTSPLEMHHIQTGEHNTFTSIIKSSDMYNIFERLLFWDRSQMSIGLPKKGNTNPNVLQQDARESFGPYSEFSKIVERSNHIEDLIDEAFGTDLSRSFRRISGSDPKGWVRDFQEQFYKHFTYFLIHTFTGIKPTRIFLENTSLDSINSATGHLAGQVQGDSVKKILIGGIDLEKSHELYHNHLDRAIEKCDATEVSKIKELKKALEPIEIISKTLDTYEKYVMDNVKNEFFEFASGSEYDTTPNRVKWVNTTSSSHTEMKSYYKDIKEQMGQVAVQIALVLTFFRVIEAAERELGASGNTWDIDGNPGVNEARKMLFKEYISRINDSMDISSIEKGKKAFNRWMKHEVIMSDSNAKYKAGVKKKKLEKKTGSKHQLMEYTNVSQWAAKEWRKYAWLFSEIWCKSDVSVTVTNVLEKQIKDGRKYCAKINFEKEVKSTCQQKRKSQKILADGKLTKAETKAIAKRIKDDTLGPWIESLHVFSSKTKAIAHKKSLSDGFKIAEISNFSDGY